MAIQWFPGHMNKLRNTLRDTLPHVDVVLEIADARAPLSSRNPLLDEIIQKKPRLLLLNKAELADPAMTSEWLYYFENRNLKTLLISAKTRMNLDRIKSETAKLYKTKDVVRVTKPRVLIVGVPNCGKSTVINALGRKHKAQAADRPGVTRDVQLYRTNSLEIYDTPGLLWPNLENQTMAARLAALAAVRDEVYTPSEAFLLLYPFLYRHYQQRLNDRYGFEANPDGYEFITQLGTRIGRLNDQEATVRHFFNDLRSGKLGTFCLEVPPGSFE